MTGFKLKDYRVGDTIAAIATFPSRSALGIIKISGKKTFEIISKVFKPAKKKNIKKVKTFTLHYGWIVEKSQVTSHKSQVVVDEVLVSVMRKPGSYTKEDVVEISSHGGSVVINKILELVLEQGARLALPGEFTYRALIKGRIDLLQAESILGIVHADTEEALTIASSQLKGEASLKIRKLKEEIKDLFIQTESLINFPEEGLSVSLDLGKKIKRLAKEVDELLKGSEEGRIINEGLRCVICGKSNAGKSTLFNRLLGEERVIVSEIHGTTRDVVKETINIKGVPLKIYDTAGILEPKDLVAKKALEKTTEIFEKADLVILILDSSRPLDKGDFFLLEKVKTKDTILVINKIDLPKRLNLKGLPNISGTKVKMSALKNTDLRSLEKAVYDKVYRGSLARENIIFLNQYQRQILKKLSTHILQVNKFLNEGHTIDFINLSLKECLEDLGKLSGEVLSSEILESIFSRFCIGK